MLKKLFRILVGFSAACVGAGVTVVLFVLTPAEIAGLPPDVRADRMVKAFDLAVAFAIQAALFTAPFALVALALGEAMRRRQWTYYAIVGLVMAGLGLYAQHTTEGVGQASIANSYALTAFLTAGLVGGLIYWLVSGRFAGGGPDSPPALAVQRIADNNKPAPNDTPARQMPVPETTAKA